MLFALNNIFYFQSEFWSNEFFVKYINSDSSLSSDFRLTAVVERSFLFSFLCSKKAVVFKINVIFK